MQINQLTEHLIKITHHQTESQKKGLEFFWGFIPFLFTVLNDLGNFQFLINRITVR